MTAAFTDTLMHVCGRCGFDFDGVPEGGRSCPSCGSSERLAITARDACEQLARIDAALDMMKVKRFDDACWPGSILHRVTHLGWLSDPANPDVARRNRFASLGFKKQLDAGLRRSGRRHV